MPGAIDKSVWVGSQEQPRWTVYLTNGTQQIINGIKSFSHPQPNTFNENGIHRDAVTAAVGQVYQIDVLCTGEISDETFALFGFRTDNDFVVTPTIIYHYFNRDSGGEGLNVQTFPSETSLEITPNNWYTAKARVATDALEMYIHGGPEGYNNQLIATESFSGIHSGFIRTQFNVAGTSAGQFFRVKNYIVSKSLSTVAVNQPIDMAALAFMTKEGIS